MAATTPPVELHVVSDATGETAARLVTALEAQFPDQEFVEIRHPRVESEDDLHLAVNRMKGRPAVLVYTLVQPELRDAMRTHHWFDAGARNTGGMPTARNRLARIGRARGRSMAA